MPSTGNRVEMTTIDRFIQADLPNSRSFGVSSDGLSTIHVGGAAGSTHRLWQQQHPAMAQDDARVLRAWLDNRRRGEHRRSSSASLVRQGFGTPQPAMTAAPALSGASPSRRQPRLHPKTIRSGTPSCRGDAD